MKNTILALFMVCVLASAFSCKQEKKSSGQQEAVQIKSVEINYLTVDELIASGENLAGKTIYVQGIIEHVCEHTWKRFKIINPGGKNELKIELGENSKPVDISIEGNTVKVTGKLVATDMGPDQVKQWEQKMRTNHKGEEDTGHFKEEVAKIQSIYKKIVDGEIPCFTMYTVDCEEYEFEKI